MARDARKRSSQATCEQLLRGLLAVIGATLLLATFAIVLPVSWMNATHQWLGMGDLPTEPVVIYLARSTSLLYAMHGAILMATSLRYSQLSSLVPLLATLHLLMGMVITVIDFTAQMPWYWTLAEGPGIVLGALLTFALWRGATRPEPDDAVL